MPAPPSPSSAHRRRALRRRARRHPAGAGHAGPAVHHAAPRDRAPPGQPTQGADLPWAKAHRRMDRVLVHSPNQIELLHRRLGFSLQQLHLIPYGVDTEYWAPGPRGEDVDLVLSTGREHRDHQTLVDALGAPPACSSPTAAPTRPGPTGGAPRPGPSGSSAGRSATSSCASTTTGPRSSSCHCCPRRIPSASPRCWRPWPWPSRSSSPTPRACAASSNTDRRVWSCRRATLPPCGAPCETCWRTPTPARRLGQSAREAVLERFSLDQFVDELGRHLDELAGSAAHAGAPAMSRGALALTGNADADVGRGDAHLPAGASPLLRPRSHAPQLRRAVRGGRRSLALRDFCRDVRLVPARPDGPITRRARQARWTASRLPFHAREFYGARMQAALDSLLAERRFDIVQIELPR